MTRRRFILHVTEALGGGVTSAVIAMAEALPEYGHALLAHRRIAHDIGQDVGVSFEHVYDLPNTPLAAIKSINRLYELTKPAVVHAHSSVAGAYVRLSAVPTSRIAYSPHCFAFDRLDRPRASRIAYRLIERSLAGRTGVFCAVSPFEANQAAVLGHAMVRYIPNRLGLDIPRLAEYRSPARVVSAGRVCAQKDWRMFLEVKSRLEGLRADWVWVGGGASTDENVLRSQGVEVTGWVSRDRLMQELAESTVYLHTAQWEGAPITLLEAAGSGLPLVLRRIQSLASLGAPNLRETAAELADRVRDFSDSAEWAAGQQDSLRFESAFTAERQADSLRDAYSLLATRAGASHYPEMPFDRSTTNGEQV